MRVLSRLLPLVLLACLVVPSPDALARRHRAPEGGPAAAGVADFDYYLLSLSWSPAYCQLRPNDRTQCGNRRYAFVLHGLWPQYLAGGYPERCESDATLSRAVVDRMLPIMPSPRLIAHEWDKHGRCTGLTAEQYFGAAERAFGAIRAVPAFEADRPPQSLAADQIVAAIRAANPQIPSDGIAVKCRGPELEEVRVCLSKSLQPIGCGRGVRNQCRGGPIQIRPVR